MDVEGSVELWVWGSTRNITTTCESSQVVMSLVGVESPYDKSQMFLESKEKPSTLSIPKQVT